MYVWIGQSGLLSSRRVLILSTCVPTHPTSEELVRWVPRYLPTNLNIPDHMGIKIAPPTEDVLKSSQVKSSLGSRLDTCKPECFT